MKLVVRCEQCRRENTFPLGSTGMILVAEDAVSCSFCGGKSVVLVHEPNTNKSSGC
jgi:hypothetical protein